MSWADHSGDPLPDGHPERTPWRATRRQRPWRATLSAIVVAGTGPLAFLLARSMAGDHRALF